MASCTPVSLAGALTIQGGSPCGSGCGGAPALKTQQLSLGCGVGVYSTVVSTDLPIAINSPSAFSDVPMLDQIASIQLFYASANAPLTWRFGAGAAVANGSGGTFPTGFVGGEVLSLEIDGVTFDTTFTAGAQSAPQVSLEINAAAALAGIAHRPCTVTAGGQLQLTGQATGSDGEIAVTGSTVADTLGLVAGQYAGSGTDLAVGGLALIEFPSTAPSGRVQVKGVASVSLLAAGV